MSWFCGSGVTWGPGAYALNFPGSWTAKSEMLPSNVAHSFLQTHSFLQMDSGRVDSGLSGSTGLRGKALSRLYEKEKR